MLGIVQLDRGPSTAPRIAVEVERRATERGPVRYGSHVEHILQVHAGEPVRGLCQGGSVRFVTTRGAIDLLPVGAHEYCVQEDPSESIVLRLPPALLDLVAEELGLDPGRVGLAPRCGVRDHQIEHVGWALDAERRAGFPSGLLFRESLGFGLAVHLLRSYRAPAESRGGLPSQQLTRVREYIEAHLAGDVSLQRLARVAGVSVSHFRVLFKRSTGMTAHEYVIRCRVQRARALLIEGKQTMSEVALEVGFSHQSHMARWTRRLLGLTPAAIVRGRA